MIITVEDIKKHRPVADNLDEARRLNTYIKEAENLYIVPNLGAKLYKDISEHPENHTILLDGGYYNEDKCYFEGLKAALSLLAYARFVKNNELNVTPFGIKFKVGMDSGQMDNAYLIRHANEAENTGLSYLKGCVDYVKFNEADCCKDHSLKTVKKYKVIGL